MPSAAFALTPSTVTFPYPIGDRFARPVAVAVFLTLIPTPHDATVASPLLVACTSARAAYVALEVESDRVCDESKESKEGGLDWWEDEDSPKAVEALSAHAAAIDFISHTPATNMSELKAKATVLVTHYLTDEGGGYVAPPEALAASLLRDAGVPA